MSYAILLLFISFITDVLKSEYGFDLAVVKEE